MVVRVANSTNVISSGRIDLARLHQLRFQAKGSEQQESALSTHRCLYRQAREPVENKGSKRRNNYALECGPEWTSWICNNWTAGVTAEYTIIAC